MVSRHPMAPFKSDAPLSSYSLPVRFDAASMLHAIEAQLVVPRCPRYRRREGLCMLPRVFPLL